MKKLLIGLFALLLVFGLLSCSSESLLGADELASIENPDTGEGSSKEFTGGTVNVPVVNAGFETSWTGTTTAPTGWTRSSTATGFTTARNTTYKYAGTASLALASTTSTTYYVYQYVNAVPNAEYTVSAKFLDNGNSKARLYIYYYNGTTSLGSTYSGYSVNSASWQTLSKDFTTPADTTQIRIDLRIYDDPTGSRGTIYADDVIVLGPASSSSSSVSSSSSSSSAGGSEINIVSEPFDGNSGLTGWTKSDTTNINYYTGTYKIGTGAMQVKFVGIASRTIDTTGFTDIRFKFKLAGSSMEAGEYGVAEYNTGSGWVEAGRMADPSDTGAYTAFDIALPAAAANNANLQIRFRMVGNASADYLYVEDVYVSGVGGTVAPPTVALANPGFEEVWSGTTTAPTGWLRSSTATGFTTERNTTTKFAGSASLAMARTSSTSYYIYQEFSALPDEVYNVSAKVLDNQNGKVRFYIRFFEGTTLLSGAKYSDYSVDSASWQTIGLTFTNPASTTKMSVEIRSYDDPTSSRGTQFIDDVTLTKVTYENTAPTVTISGIANNNKVGGKVTVTANIVGNCTSVKFYKGTTLVATDTTAPYSAVYDFNADTPNANYTIKAIAYNGASLSNVATLTVNKPNHDYRGAGANVGDNGTFFKVWAPHATKVALAGDFNSWSATDHLLWNASGWWYGFQPSATHGSKYKFVITGPNGTVWKPDPYARYMENSVGASIVWNPNNYSWSSTSYSIPSFENMIIYELHVRSFVGKNDGQTYPGTFRKVVTKLDYLKSLGVNMIELMPCGEFPGDQSWGYNTISYFAVESAYGNPDDLKYLVDEAHKRGIGVIMDVVYNHVGASDNYLYNFDTDTEFEDGGIYFNNVQTPWGMAPDFGRNEVKQYFRDNALYWLAEYRMDGLRWDATAFITGGDGWNFMRDINWDCRTAFPNKILIAENLPYDNALMSGANFHSCWYVDFHHKVKAALHAGGYCNLDEVKSGINGGSPSHHTWRTIYAISHDEAANGKQYLVSEFGGRGNWDARAKARLAGALMLFSPGIPMLWEGEEFLQDSYFHDDYDHAVNWTYQNDADGSKMLAMYKAAISTRWLNDAMRSGTCDYTHQDNNNKILAFKRWSGGNVVLVVANFSGVSFTGNSYGVGTGGQTGQWQQIFCSQDAAYGGWDGAGNAFHEPWTQGDGKIYINVPKYGIVVMKLK